MTLIHIPQKPGHLQIASWSKVQEKTIHPVGRASHSSRVQLTSYDLTIKLKVG